MSPVRSPWRKKFNNFFRIRLTGNVQKKRIMSEVNHNNRVKQTSNGVNKVIIHCDGGSRGNPGPSASGVVIEYNGNIKEYSQYLGEKTNNEAEYEAVIFALKKTKALLGKVGVKNREVEVLVDSELLFKQITGKYKVLDKKIQSLFLQLWNLKIDFSLIVFRHILRDGNKQADKLVNRELDTCSSVLF